MGQNHQGLGRAFESFTLNNSIGSSIHSGTNPGSFQYSPDQRSPTSSVEYGEVYQTPTIVSPFTMKPSGLPSELSRYSAYGYPSYGMQIFPWPVYASSSANPNHTIAAYPRARNGPFHHHQRELPRHSARQNTEFAAGHHNVVDIDRICQGLDVRTTVR